MKKLCILLILIFWGIFQAYSTENNPRITYSINDSWQFRLGTSDIGEDGWSMVSIPHTWNAEDCVDDFPGFYRGTGWYRKNIQVDSVMLSRSLYLFFEGANQRTKLFVNRHRVGEHIGGYTFFCFDITPYIEKEKISWLCASIIRTILKFHPFLLISLFLVEFIVMSL